ncbi:hypothetical protein IV498_01090 [Paenarthrobacter sp. Z7-10]|nr:DUF6789 family protein [Paenarthrobacter sp. Z7-10]MCZ2401814.1 hypothetical protein [Paenarthrobacter sp. Z7-10]
MREKESLRLRCLGGAVGGLAATVVMTTGLTFSDRLGVRNRQPPRKIVQAALPDLPKDTLDTVAVVTHFGYGAAAGALYAAAIPARFRNPATGTGYGLLIWALAYEGWLPALGVVPAAHREKWSRALTMLLAHVLYGATLGLVGKLRIPTSS